MGFKGSVESFSLADVFQNLAMNQQTGCLHVVTPDGAEKLVYFQSGQVKNISRGRIKALLPSDAFVARGVASPQQVETARERQRESNQPIGLCMVELGFITQDQLKDVIRIQLEEETFDLFQWERASFEFNEGNPPEGSFPDQLADGPSLPISGLIMEAARRVDEWERLRKQVSNYKEIFCMDLAARKAIEKGEMEMEVAERRTAMLIDGARDVDDLIEDSGLFKFEVLTSLSGFIQSCLIRPAGAKELAFAEEECGRNNLHRRRIKVLERLLAVGGENAKVRRELAELLAKEAQVEKACIHFSVLAEMEMQAGKKDAALELYRRILTIAPKHTKAHEQLGADYARRGLKREAYVHYKDLFDTFREQKRMKEARTAGLAAVECEPGQSELRNQVVEVLLADNQKETAAEQLEILGDQAAKIGNMKLAADSYRRAMQYKPGNKTLKNKLGDVILSKEDRRALKRRLVGTLVVIGVVALIGGGLAFLEFSNKSKIAAANRGSKGLIAAAAEHEKEDRYVDARQSYEQAISLYTPVLKVISPIYKINAEAKRNIDDLKGRIANADQRGEEVKSKGQKKAKTDLVAAEDALKKGNIYEAREMFEKVVKNNYSDEDSKKAATASMAEAQSKIDRFEDMLKRLRKNPNQAFASVEEEASFKKNLVKEFSRNPRLDIKEVELPLQIAPNNSNINVFLNGKLLGSVSQGQARELNTFRYPHEGRHRFEFRKAGYKLVEVSTGDLQSPLFYLKMEREPSYKLELKPFAPGIVLSGEAVVDGESIFVGTNNGSLLEIVEKDRPIARRYDLPGGGGIYKEVYGPINVIKNSKGQKVITYTTKAGDFVGLTPTESGFAEVWKPFKATEGALTAKPSYCKLAIVSNPVALLPCDKKLVLIDCMTGLQISGNDASLQFKAAISSPPNVINNDRTIVVGCADGNLYGVTLGSGRGEQWTTNARAAAVRGKPIIVDDKLVAGADDGRLYFFDPAKGGFKTGEVALEGSIVSEPLILNKRLYLGTILTETFWCVDLASRKWLWQKDERDIGGVSQSPTLHGNYVYFGTDTGRFYSLEADKGVIRWVYQMDSRSAIISPPLTRGKRVFAISSEGEIVGFEESEN